MKWICALALLTASCSPGITGAERSRTVGPLGGAFVMGSTNDCLDGTAAGDHVPHPVMIAPYRIDATEVTLLQYTVCVGQGGGCTPADKWDYDHQNRPVSTVTRDQARAYCHWVGGRLPTEAEWEFAARSQQSGMLTQYPWGGNGSDIAVQDCKLVPYAGCSREVNDVGTTSLDVTTRGIFDMGGNVAEWVDDDFTPGIGCAARTPREAFCGNQSHCSLDACMAAFPSCQDLCRTGLGMVDPAYCPAATDSVTSPLYRTATPVPMWKGGGADLRACMADGGMRGLTTSLRRPAVGFRCAFDGGQPPSPTLTARFELPPGNPVDCSQLTVTPISPDPKAGVWANVRATLLSDSKPTVASRRDGNGVFTFDDCGTAMRTVFVIEGAPATQISLVINMAGTCFRTSVDLSSGEPLWAFVTGNAASIACPP